MNPLSLPHVYELFAAVSKNSLMVNVLPTYLSAHLLSPPKAENNFNQDTIDFLQTLFHNYKNKT